MTRILQRSDTGPYRLSKADFEGDAVFLCRCGLSRSQPFCDGSHKATRDEAPNVLFRYVEGPTERGREPVEIRPAAVQEAAPVSPRTLEGEGAA